MFEAFSNNLSPFSSITLPQFLALQVVQSWVLKKTELLLQENLFFLWMPKFCPSYSLSAYYCDSEIVLMSQRGDRMRLLRSIFLFWCGFKTDEQCLPFLVYLLVFEMEMLLSKAATKARCSEGPTWNLSFLRTQSQSQCPRKVWPQENLVVFLHSSQNGQ